MSEFKIDFNHDRQFDSLFVYCSNEYDICIIGEVFIDV